jgi:hypothetical protein
VVGYDLPPRAMPWAVLFGPFGATDEDTGIVATVSEKAHPFPLSALRSPSFATYGTVILPGKIPRPTDH